MGPQDNNQVGLALTGYYFDGKMLRPSFNKYAITICFYDGTLFPLVEEYSIAVSLNAGI